MVDEVRVVIVVVDVAMDEVLGVVVVVGVVVELVVSPPVALQTSPEVFLTMSWSSV